MPIRINKLDARTIKGLQEVLKTKRLREALNGPSDVTVPPYKGKYRSVRTKYNGRSYASKAEAKRATDLTMLHLACKVDWFQAQVPIDIGEPGVDRPYVVDFLVSEGGRVHAEDVKGVETASFRRHRRQWALRGPFPLHVIKGKHVEIIRGGAQRED